MQHSMRHRWLEVLNRAMMLVGVIVLILSDFGGWALSAVWAQEGDGSPMQEISEALTDTYPFYQHDAIALAMTYLQSQQQADGGMDVFGFGSNPVGTARAVYVLNAVGYPVDTLVSQDGKTLIDFLETTVISSTYANGIRADDNLFPGAAGMILAAVAAAGEDTTSFGGVNLVAAINATLKPTGAYSTTAEAGFSSGAANAINQSLAIFGLVAAGQPIPQIATDWLIAQQDTQGSWFDDIDVTGYAMMALVGSGNVPATDESIQRGIDFLKSAQTVSSALWNDTGRFGEPANSTGWVMTALATAGYIPVTESWATGGTNPLEALLKLQDAEGVIAGNPNFRNAYATLEGLYGLTAQPLYLARPLRIARALTWLAEQQNADGSWNSFAGPDPGATIESVLAFAAAGYDPNSVTSSGNTPLAYLASTATTYTRDDSNRIFPARTGKLIVGVVATGGDPANFGTGNLNLVADLRATLQATGAYSTTASQGFASGSAGPINQSLAILGLVAAGETVPVSATDYLASLQETNGSWGSVDATGLALQALIATGIPANNTDMVEALTYLRNNQANVGGWDYTSTPETQAISTNSTVYAIQGLLAAGVDLTDSDWRKHGHSPLGVLGSYQKPDGPFVVNWNYAGISAFYNPTADNLLATQQAIPALVGTFYPYTTLDPATLKPFAAIPHGPDPDRTVVAPPSAMFGRDKTSVAVTVPFGSDLNGTGVLTLEWRVVGDTFTPISTTRQSGFYSATLDLGGTDITPLDTLEFRATFSDADSVQNGSTSGSEATAVSQLSPYRLYLPLLSHSAGSSSTGDKNRAGLVVRFSNGSIETRCIAFQEVSITGEDLIRRSGLATEIATSSGLGAAVCKIGNEGCPVNDCFCNSERFWKYFLREDSAWSIAPVGMSTRTVRHGDMDGWSWGSFDDSQAAPPDTTFAEVCTAP